MHVMIGLTVRDVITGFSGVVTGRCEYITGCAQVLLQPSVKPDGDFVESRWLDETRVEIVDSGSMVKIPFKTEAPLGPDKPAPRK